MVGAGGESCTERGSRCSCPCSSFTALRCCETASPLPKALRLQTGFAWGHNSTCIALSILLQKLDLYTRKTLLWRGHSSFLLLRLSLLPPPCRLLEQNLIFVHAVQQRPGKGRWILQPVPGPLSPHYGIRSLSEGAL